MCNIRYQIWVQALKVELSSKWLPLRVVARQPSCYYWLSENNNHGAEVSCNGIRFKLGFMKRGQWFESWNVERLKETHRQTDGQTDRQPDRQTSWLIRKPTFSRVFFVCVYACLFQLFKQLTVVQEACDGDYTTTDDPALYWWCHNNNNGTEDILNWGRIYRHVTEILEIMYGDRIFRTILKFC